MNAVYKLTIVHYMNPRFDWFNPDFPSVFLTFLRFSQGVPPLFPRFAPFFSGSSPTLTPKTAPFNGPCTVPSGGARCSARADAPAPLRGRPRRRHTRSRGDGPPKKPACRGNQWMDHGWIVDLLLIIRLMAIKCY
jgi:hypothetical protein